MERAIRQRKIPFLSDPRFTPASHVCNPQQQKKHKTVT